MKKYIAMVLSLICVLGLTGCIGKSVRYDIGQASTIIIKSGLTSEEVRISDSELISKITEDINSLRFEKTAESNDEMNYIYMLTWLDEKSNVIETVTVTSENGYQIRHNGYYYKVCADLCIDTSLIEQAFDKQSSSGEN